MKEPTVYHDALYKLAQVGQSMGVRIVRVLELVENNRYSAQPMEFDQSGDLQGTGDPLEVINLSEPADADGLLPADTHAVALDVEGRWVIFVRTAQSVMFAKVIDSLGDGMYTVRLQEITSAGEYVDKPDTDDFTACNLAEVSLGPGAAVEDGTYVLISAIPDTSNPPQNRYVFDHPAYAKYLD